MIMKAICDFTSIPKLQKQGEDFGVPACFLPLMGKAFIQHVMEYIERLGIHELEIYLSEYADELEQFLGDGERWGVKIAYHLLKKKSDVLARIEQAGSTTDDEYLLICNNRNLPFIKIEDLREAVRFQDQKGNDTQWRYCTKRQLQEQLPVIVVESLNVLTAAGYLDSLQMMLSRKGEGLIVYGKEVREGIWAGPGTKLPPTSTLVAPVYLGSQVRIGDQSIIGPNAEIGSGCIIDSNSCVIDSSVLMGSFIGKNLDVRRCMVNQNRILNAEHAAVYTATDEMLFTAVDSDDDISSRSVVSALSRLLALIFGLITLPILLLLVIYKKIILREPLKRLDIVVHPQLINVERLGKPRTVRRTFFQMRANIKGSLWKHFLWILIPNLWAVVVGRIRFFGIPSKSLDDFNKLSRDWQGLYLRSKPGIITEADLLYDDYPGDEMLFAAEMYYSVMESPSYNLKLLGRYIKILFVGRRS
jgi:NDP-sugar pyrophosphorylase family protein